MVAVEETPSEEREEYEYVTEAYGAVSQSAKVTKHVSRVKLPNSGLSWNADLLVREMLRNCLDCLLFRLMMKVGTVRHQWPNLNRLASHCSKQRG